MANNKHPWEIAKPLGAPRKFETPEALWEACVDYFQWVVDNPLLETKLVSFKGDSKKEEVPKMRAMSLRALSVHIGIHQATWEVWRKNREDLSGVINTVDDIIRNQKFEGAAAELLNANIISRDLGLMDKVDHVSSDGSMSPKEPTLSKEQAKELLEKDG